MAWYPAPRDKSNGDWRRSGMLAGRTSWIWGGGGGRSGCCCAGPAGRGVTVDWLISPVARKAGLYRSESGKELVMTNGLIRRAWRLAPDAATVGFDNLRTGQGMLRGVKPEAVLEVNGTAYDVGGLAGQPDYAYLLPQWVDGM